MSDIQSEVTDFNTKLNEANDFAERLSCLMRLKNINGQQLADAVGISKANVSTLVNRKVTNPPATTVLEMARIFQVDPEWLTFGTGSPIRKTYSPDEDTQKEIITKSLKLNLEKYGYAPVKSLSYYRNEYEIVSDRLLMSFDIKPEDCTVYTNAGDEMAPVLLNGDSILVHNFTGQIVNGKIYALAINDSQTICRRLYQKVTSKEITMKCEDEAFPEENLFLEKTSIKILGRVIAILNRELN